MDKGQFEDYLSSFTDAGACMASFGNQERFFRLNTIKTDERRFGAFSSIARTPSRYCEDAFRLDEGAGFDIGRTWEYFLGYIYPQSLPSMLVSKALAPGPGQTVLDASASPGSKFSHMAMLMRNQGILVGNDIKKDKISALYATINRMNVLNCIVTMRDAAKLDWACRFDKVLIDAPCTALGSAGAAIGRWEIEHSKKIAAIQKKMLFSCYDALKPGGSLIYSTCTYAREENEEVVLNLLENVPGKHFGLELPPGIAIFYAKGVRIGRKELPTSTIHGELGYAACDFGFNPTNSLIQNLGHLATRNKIVLNEEEAKGFAEGRDIARDLGASSKHIIVMYGEHCLGLGHYDGKRKRLVNRLPEKRRRRINNTIKARSPPSAMAAIKKRQG